jgi:DNA-binding NtrC family response regulator
MKKILWLDDNEKLIDWSIEVFQENGFDILKATTISRALTILRTEKLDGVLLDVKLQGGEDGLELLQEIHVHYPTLKVVIFTAYPDVMDHIFAQRFGASFYLENSFAKIEKPIPPEQLSRFFAVLRQLFEDESEGPKVSSETIVIRPLSVFCSYSHRDARLRNKLEDHLSNLKRQGKISVWHDRDITCGEEWGGKSRNT